MRNEVGQLRKIAPRATRDPLPLTASAEPLPFTPPAAVDDAITQLGVAASRGDFSALDKLAELAAAAMKARTNEHQYVLGHLDSAFRVLGTEAGNGNDTAFQALWIATRKDHLQGLATLQLGTAAAMGNEKALEPLLAPLLERGRSQGSG